jgi:two-component system aerobic respiration control sensor histidine kinase ArcB
MTLQTFTPPEPGHSSQLQTTTFTAPSAALPYDFSGLGKLAKDACFVRQMQQLFLGRVPDQMAQFAASIEAEDWLTVAQQAHSLKSTFGNMRIEPGTALLKELEIMAHQHRDKLALLAVLKLVAAAAETVAGIFRHELGIAA